MCMVTFLSAINISGAADSVNGPISLLVASCSLLVQSNTDSHGSPILISVY